MLPLLGILIPDFGIVEMFEGGGNRGSRGSGELDA